MMRILVKTSDGGFHIQEVSSASGTSDGKLVFSTIHIAKTVVDLKDQQNLKTALVDLMRDGYVDLTDYDCV